jgi:hypothetical protein
VKRLILLPLIVGVMLAGCAGHDYVVKNNELHLSLNKPESKTVYFASSLDGFKLHRMERLGGNRWQIVVSAGREFRYFYIVDDLVVTPPCRLKERDDFGTENCVYVPEM